MERNYYNEVEHFIRKYKVNKRARNYQEENDRVFTYWNVGRLIIEAQGNIRAKYGEELIQEWSKELTKEYGKGYDVSNLKRFRQFYMMYPKGAPVAHLSWSHYQYIMPIKDDNKRNYYINLCITNNLSKRELIKEIKNNSYERVLDKPKKIDIINYESEESQTYNIKEHIKNPIIIKLNSEDKLLKEKDLQLKILAELKNFFMELGEGYSYVGNEYKIKYGNKNYYIDILLFHVELVCYVVVELKMRELKYEDKAQMEFYMKAVDDTLKRKAHNNTIGIIVSKKQDQFIVNFVSNKSIIPLTYSLTEN